MYATTDNSSSRFDQAASPMRPPAGKIVGIWARGRRRYTPWAYPRLRALAATRFAVGIFLTGLGALMLSHGYGWAAVPLAGAALNLAIAYLDNTVARTAARRA